MAEVLVFDVEGIHVTETHSFQWEDKPIVIMSGSSESEIYIKSVHPEYVERINKQGEKIHRYNATTWGICVTDTGDVYFTDNENGNISCLDPSGSVSTIFSTQPMIPSGICQSGDGGLLVTMGDNKSDLLYQLDPDTKRLVRHMTLTGDVIREYEFQEDGHTRLFTVPYRVRLNGNSDICVVNWTSENTGNLVILSFSGRQRSVYCGQNLNQDFYPHDVECDPRCHILVTDVYNQRVHLLSPDGQFLKYLLTDKEVNLPTALFLYGSTLWVGNYKGSVKVFQFR
jgi:hypothetical protein